MPLEPPEYPPPNPPPLALAKDTVGTPISEITIIAAMSFVVFKTRFLSIDVTGQPHTHHHPSRYGPKKTKYSRTSGLYVVMCLRFSLPLSGGVAEAALCCAHQARHISSADHLNLSSLSLQGATWSILECARRTSTFRACAFREQEDGQAAPSLPSEAARCVSTEDHQAPSPPFLSGRDDMMNPISQIEFLIHTFKRESWP